MANSSVAKSALSRSEFAIESGDFELHFGRDCPKSQGFQIERRFNVLTTLKIKNLGHLAFAFNSGRALLASLDRNMESPSYQAFPLLARRPRSNGIAEL